MPSTPIPMDDRFLTLVRASLERNHIALSEVDLQDLARAVERLEPLFEHVRSCEPGFHDGAEQESIDE